MYILSTVLITALTGGGIALEMPGGGDDKIQSEVAELRVEVAQNYNYREQQWAQQRNYHKQRELSEIDWRLRSITAEVNRLNQLPVYLDRGLTSQEMWQVEQLKIQWNLLQQRRNDVLRSN